MSMNDEARELYFYMTTSCARAMAAAEAAFRNYERKIAKGTYDPALARKGLAYAVTTAAKEYLREHGAPGDDWAAMFPPAVRAAVADAIMADTETEWSAGNYWGERAVA